MESIIENQLKSRNNLVIIQDQNQDRPAHVKKSHDRHKEAGNRADPLDAAEDDDADENDQNQPCHPVFDTEAVLCNIGNRIGLDAVAYPQSGKSSKQRKSDGESFKSAAESAFDIIHRPA